MIMTSEKLQQTIQHQMRIPEGYKKTKSGIIPADWTTYTLGDIYTERKEAGIPSLPILTVSIHSGVSDGALDDDELGKKVKRIEDRTQYRTTRSGDLVFNMMRAWQGAIGVVRSDGLVSPAYIVATPNESVVYPPFMDYYMKTPEMVNRIHRKSYGVTDFRLRLYWDSFAIIDCALPPLPEQKKIAKILSTQDKIIELYERKIEELEKLKKAFMQKMFPKKGESVPKWRLPQFTDPWEERKFGTMFKRRTERNNGQFDNTRWISVAKMYFQEAEKVSSNNIDTRTYVMRRGDIAFEGHSNNEYKYGRFVANDIGDGVISELFPIYMHIDDYDESYWKYAIQIENIMAPKLLRCIEISYTSSNKLDEDFFLKESILVPTISEQQQIGLYFRSMDKLIKLHQQKLNQEKQKKKALMQLLLSGVVRVNV